MSSRSFNHLVTAFTTVSLSTAAVAQKAEESAIPLPSKVQRDFLNSPQIRTTRGPGPTLATTVEVTAVPADSTYYEATKATDRLKQPLRSANELLILLNPTLNGTQILALLKEYRLDVVQTLPEIGAVVVDASRRLGTKALVTSAKSLAAVSDTSLSRLAGTLAKDKRFLAVTVNSVISRFELKSAVTATPPPPVIGAATERVDWGIADARFDRVWPRMTKPVRVGVIDVGFSAHEDLLTETALPGPLQVDDHGNHVSGIMCAQHNGLGVKGALRDCTVVVSSGRLMLTGGDAPQGHGVSPFVAQFSEYLATVLELLISPKGVRVINLSLGYNWMPNFGLDPRAPAADEVRNDVRGQGRMFASVLALAKSKGIAVVMAAGNDSSELATPLEADWASPFNFGSRLVEKADGWSNGVIVEAYDAQHRRAGFSNSKGHVACPGVDILSTLATSKHSYGVMSGTSMAAPYCAAGLAAVIALRPELDLRQAIGCMTSGPAKIDDGTPRFDAEYAIARCGVGGGGQ